MEQLSFVELTNNSILNEQTDYGISFGDKPPEGVENYLGILTMVSENTGVLNFRNFVGQFDLFGVNITVRSFKISQECYEDMLEYICKKMTELPFSFNNPSFEAVDINTSNSTTIMYHTYLILRYIILGSETNLNGAFENIFKNPARRMKGETFDCDVWDIKGFRIETMNSIIAQPDKWCVLNETNRLCDTELSRKLSTGKESFFFPTNVIGKNVVSTLDTPENRFTKYFLKICDDLLYFFKNRLANIKMLNRQSVINDLKYMVEIIETLQIQPFFDEISCFSNIPNNSTILQKRNGYKEVFGFYNLLQCSLTIPFLEQEAKLLIENKDIAELYEIWAYFKLLEIIEDTLGIPPTRADIFNEDDFKASLKQSVFVEFLYKGIEIRVWYNKTFGSRKGSYSLPLRPDIVIETPKGKYIFDAKFKLELINWEDIEEEKEFTFKNGDIYKMHTYKDAISNVKLACILYPNKDNTRDKFFWENEFNCTGVGAFSLLPGVEPVGLKKLFKEAVFEY